MKNSYAPVVAIAGLALLGGVVATNVVLNRGEDPTIVVGAQPAAAVQSSLTTLEYQPLVEPFPTPVEDCDPNGTYQHVANCSLAEAVSVDQQIDALQEERFLAAASDAERRELLAENEAWLADRQQQLTQASENASLDEAEAVTSEAQLFLTLSQERLNELQ